MRSVILAMTLGLGLLPSTLAGSASAAPDAPITDVKSLAGEWRAVGGTSPAAIRIKPDGKEVLTFTRADVKGSARLERVK